MPWGLLATLLFYTGTFVLSALLDRRETPENKPGEPQFPTADGSAPIPVVYGTTRVGMNVVHKAGLTLGENTNRNGALSFGWSSSHLGYFYLLDLVAVICHGPLGALHDVIVDGTHWLTRTGYVSSISAIGDGGPTYVTKRAIAQPGLGGELPVYTYDQAAGIPITITASDLLGGKYGRGGIGAGRDAESSGLMRLWPGTGAIEHNARIESLAGQALPVYPRIVTVTFENNFYFGNSEQLPSIEFVISRAPESPLAGTGYIGNNTANAGTEANPGAILWDLLTNDVYGLGFPAADLDFGSFALLARSVDTGQDITADFNVGLSFVLKDATTGKAAISDLLRTLDGVLYMHPTTGLLCVRLLRAPDAPHWGYGEADQILLDESCITSLEWDDTAPETTVNEVHVDFIDRARDYAKNTVTVRNVASIQATDHVEPRTVNFLGVQDAALATRLAWRELRALSTTLGRATITLDRTGYIFTPGQFFTLNWAARAIVGKIMRVVSVRDVPRGGVQIDAIEDVYSSPPAAFDVETTPEPVPPAASAEVPPYVEPRRAPSTISMTEGDMYWLRIFDPQSRVTLVRFLDEDGIEYTQEPSVSYPLIVVGAGLADKKIIYEVTWTDANGDDQLISGEMPPMSRAYRPPTLALRWSVSGGTVTVEAVKPVFTAKDAAADVWMAASLIGFQSFSNIGPSPDKLTVAPYTISFAYPAPGVSVYVSAVAAIPDAVSGFPYGDYAYLTITGAPSGSGMGGSPSGAAGGDLAGTYPDPTIKADVALSGNPTAPTQSAGNNTTRLANTAFVQAAITALVNSSPTTLDTLKELADALGDDPNFATTMATALGLKAPLASPTLTGDPKAPTPAPGDNDTSIATTAFVQAAVAAASGTGVGTATGVVAECWNQENVLVAQDSTWLRVPFGFTITGAEIVSDVAGSISIELYRSTYAAWATLTKLSASAPIALSGAQKAQPALTGWTTAVAAGDYLMLRITGTPVSVSKVTVTLTGTRT